jgi:hypothetical protein
MLISCLVYSSTLKIEASCSLETSFKFQRTLSHFIPECRSLHKHRCEYLKSYIVVLCITRIFQMRSVSFALLISVDIHLLQIEICCYKVKINICYKTNSLIYFNAWDIHYSKYTSVESNGTCTLSIYLWFYSPCGICSLFQFPNLYTVGRTPWTGYQPVARPLPTHRTTQISIL